MAEESAAQQPSAGQGKGLAALIGRWEKVTGSQCAEKYPEHLQFTERGIYFGKSEETSTSLYHTVWDAGRYLITDEQNVKLSTSNDAEVVYRFSASNDLLIFRDQDGCEFEYRRVCQD